MDAILAGLEQFRWRQKGCSFRVTIYTQLGSGAVVYPSTLGSGWRAAVCGLDMKDTYDTPAQAKKAARAEWTRQHMTQLV